jgi:FkbM family methyltransferase
MPQPLALAEGADRGSVVVPSIFGPMLAHSEDLITRQLVEFGAHTRNELALLQSFVQEGDLVYDIGAHIGTFTIPLAAAAGPAGRVIAAEADERSFQILFRNLHHRGLAREGSPLHAVVGNEAGNFRTHPVPGNSGATFVLPDPAGDCCTTWRLDDLHEHFGESRKVAIVKIDVEGMELSVLESGERMIARDRPILYIEISVEQLQRYAVNASQIGAFLARYGYRLFRNVGDRNSRSDDFIMVELKSIAAAPVFFDLLAVPEGDVRMPAVLAATHH